MEYEIKRTHQFRLDLRELWEFRELLYFFTLRDIKIKYKQTVLGAAWAVLQPLLMMAIFTLFFSKSIHTAGELPYQLFVFSGLLLWNIFSSGISNAGNSMVTNANIIKKIYFPRIIIPLSAILSTMLDFFMSLILFSGLLIYFGKFSMIFSLALWIFPALLITLLTSFGLGSLLAALNVKYRDFRYVIPFMVQVLLFLTPVIYPVSVLPSESLQWILNLNPLAGAIDIIRCAISGASLNWSLIATSFIGSLFLFALGIFYFRRTEYYFADLA